MSEPTAIISARVPMAFYRQVIDHAAKHDPGQGGRTRVIVAALESYIAIKPKVERLPSHKVKRPFKPLSEHTKARLAVYKWLQASGFRGLTTAEIAVRASTSANDIATRVKELHSEGYVAATGEYRKSCSGYKMLAVYRVTDKQIPWEGK